MRGERWEVNSLLKASWNQFKYSLSYKADPVSKTKPKYAALMEVHLYVGVSSKVYSEYVSSDITWTVILQGKVAKEGRAGAGFCIIVTRIST